mmetsp:Transcript_11863/g.21740  ORF Transcript_11863/g.21740 Transcript_11863/m.21740 type:complete len:208 (-) Transcript_11863:161-784(-)
MCFEIGIHNLQSSFQEHVNRWAGDVVVQGRKHQTFHTKDVVTCICVCGNVDEILHFWWINLFILCCQQHSNNTDKLELLPADHFLIQKSVDNFHGQEKGFRQELELEVHINQPVDKDCSHFFINVSLDAAHVVRRGSPDQLRFSKMVKYFFQVICRVQWVGSVLLIRPGTCWARSRRQQRCSATMGRDTAKPKFARRWVRLGRAVGL